MRSNGALQTSDLSTDMHELRKTYAETGYVIAKQVFSASSLATLGESLRAVLNKPAHDESDLTSPISDLIMKREAQDHNLVYKASQSVGSSAATYQLLGGSGIFDLVSEVTGYDKAGLHVMPMYLIVQPPSDERFDYSWHQDGSYYAWCKDFLTLWFPVNRSTKRDTGTISVLRGSHQDGPRETDTFLKHGFFKQIQSRLKPGEEANEEWIEADLGDCCIMAGNAVHRSVANRSNSPRVAGVLRIASLGEEQAYERERFYCVHKS